MVGKFRLLNNDVVLQPSIVKSRGWSRSTVLLKETNLTTMQMLKTPFDLFVLYNITFNFHHLWFQLLFLFIISHSQLWSLVSSEKIYILSM